MEERAQTYGKNPAEVARIFEDIISGVIKYVHFSDGRKYKIMVEKVDEIDDENNKNIQT